MHNAVTALTLLGGAETRVQALRRIAAGAGRSALDRATPNLSARECEQLCDHLHRVYGGPADRPHLLPLEPDLLAEHLAWTTLHALEEEGGDQALDFLDRTTEDADPASLGHALGTLAGAAAENRAKDSSLRERAVRWLQHILEADPRRRCPIAFQVALGELGDRLRAGELGTALARVAEEHPDVFLPDLARSLNNLGVFLSALGRRQEALELARQAVEIFLALAERWPEAFAGRLATAVRTLEQALPDGAQDQGGQALLRKAQALLERLGGGQR